MVSRAGEIRAAVAVEDRLFRALAVLRLVLLAHALLFNLLRLDDVRRPAVLLVLLGVLVAWTLVVGWLYRDPVRRSWPTLAGDLAVALGLLAATPLAAGGDYQATVPGYWVTAAVLAWAVRFGLPGGAGAAVVVAAADLLLRPEIGQTNLGNAYLLLIGGPIVGYMAGSLQRMAAERDAAQRAQAAAEERTRLARAVHDGVLQVLALVQRRGGELGGEAAELGRLAGEQEDRLRTLIRTQDAVRPEEAADAATTPVDVAAAIGGQALRPGVEVVLPGEPVHLPGATAAELVAAVGACLDNVRTHAGAGARAWVLVEELADRVVVSVRDDGPGIPAGRLEEAAAQGRLGVSQSVRGRLADLGGTADLLTGDDGTEWELTVPRGRA